MTRGVTLEPGTVVVLSLDGTLAYVEDVQPTFAAVIALPEQLTERINDRVFTPGRVGAKKISPFSSADRTLDRDSLTPRNTEFLETYETLRGKHGPNFVQRTPEEEAALSVTKAEPKKRRSKASPEDKAAKRRERRLAKTPCLKCGQLPVHANHHGGGCEYTGPVKKERAAREPKDPNPSFAIVNTDLSQVQAANDKFNQGNRFHRVFRALEGLPESKGTLAQIMAALVQDGGRPVTNPEKVSRRALKQLVDAGNVTR